MGDDPMSLEARFNRLANIYNYEHAAAVKSIQTFHHQADAAEAQRDRLAAALRVLVVEYHDLAHHAQLPFGCTAVVCGDARAALADVPDDRAHRRDEAYRAMVEALNNIELYAIAEASVTDGFSEGVRVAHKLGGIARAALALARQVETE
ncbi:MAG: hypothetical protein KGI71_04215 [Patescibacteria group bacterium]|nr:hypothetical protein [Patescibacteria group bacterium]